MSQQYRRIQEQLFTRTRDDFGLSDAEAWVILDDVVRNLEALAADLTPHAEPSADPAASPQRIMQALTSLADQLECAVLAQIVAHLAEAGILAGRPLPGPALEPLTQFVCGLRQAMPPVTHGRGNWPAPVAASPIGRPSTPNRST